MVGYRNHITNKFDVGIISAKDSRSYTICTESGVHVSRNCIDLKQTDIPFELKTQTRFMSNNANHKKFITNKQQTQSLYTFYSVQDQSGFGPQPNV